MHGASLRELIELLGSPDPRVRDDLTYVRLAEGLSRGVGDGQLRALGERLVEMLGDERPWARSFGALVLAEVVTRDNAVGELPGVVVHHWLDRFSRWYRDEEDLRGFDDTVGWIHAVAHGADAVGAFAQSPHLTTPDLTGVLDLARDRLLTSGSVLFANHEGDRVASGLGLVLARPELTTRDRVEWLGPIDESFSRGEPGPVPPWVSNTLHSLIALYLLVDRGGRRPGDAPVAFAIPDADSVKEAIARPVRRVFPHLG